MGRCGWVLFGVVLGVLGGCAPMDPPPQPPVEPSSREGWPRATEVVAEDETARVTVRAQTDRIEGDWVLRMLVVVASNDEQAHEMMLDIGRATTGTMTREGFDDEPCEPGSINGSFDHHGFRRRVVVPANGVARFRYLVRSVGMRCPGGLLATSIAPTWIDGRYDHHLPYLSFDLLLNRGAPDLEVDTSDMSAPGNVVFRTR